MGVIEHCATGGREGEGAPLDVLDVVDLLGEGVGGVDRDDLPVELAVVDHGVNADALDRVDAAHVEGAAGDLDDVNGVVVAKDAAGGLVLVAGVLPGLGQEAVVPVDVVGVEAEFALLGVLLDGVCGLVLQVAWG